VQTCGDERSWSRAQPDAFLGYIRDHGRNGKFISERGDTCADCDSQLLVDDSDRILHRKQPWSASQFEIIVFGFKCTARSRRPHSDFRKRDWWKATDGTESDRYTLSSAGNPCNAPKVAPARQNFTGSQ
jgi:hypothetical protein